ncbi:MAG TPA: TolC family protein [Candidatus Acidoferrales bacterium]|nr:TolC family protein [Candidatus Acidoferrales bacterium]
MKKISACLFLAGLGSAVPAQTNVPPARLMSLQDCITEALQHNFDVRVERYEPVKSQLSLDAAYEGYDPTFNINGQHNFNETAGQYYNGLFVPAQVSDQNVFNSSLGGTLPSGLQYSFSGNVANTYGSQSGFPFDTTSGSMGVTLDQPLLKNLWIDSTRLAISAAKNQIKYTKQGLRLQLITTVSAVENAYYELIYARENLTVEQQALELAQTQLDQDRQRVEVGSLAPLDVQQDESQVAQSRANLIAAQFTLQTDENVLKNLITDNYLTWQGTELRPTATLEAVRQLFDLQDSWSKGMASRPDLLQAKVTLEQQGIQLKYDYNQIFPQLDLTGSYGFNGSGVQYNQAFGQIAEGSGPFYSYGGKLTMPLANLAARSVYKSDRAVQQQDLLKLKQLEQNVMVEIDNAVKQAQSAWESVDATKEARIYAEAALDAEQKKYAVGKSTTFTVLQLQDNLTSARSAEIRALANYQEALTNLAQQEGTTLERRDVEVTGK